MKFKVTKSIVFVGLMGAGKTAIGNAVAQKLKLPFVDSDQEIEAAANMSISEIFAQFGETDFRQKEAQVIERLLHEVPCVLSTGGGAYTNKATRSIINNSSSSVWLKADLELLWERVRNRNTRPLLKVDDPYRALADLYEAREPMYQEAKYFICAERGLSIAQMTERVLQALLADPDSGVEILE